MRATRGVGQIWEPRLDRPVRLGYGQRPALPGAQVAQLVEHATENRSVGGSIPPLGTFIAGFLRLSVGIWCKWCSLPWAAFALGRDALLACRLDHERG